MLSGLWSRGYALRNHVLRLLKSNTHDLPGVVLCMRHCKDRHRYLMAHLFIQAGYFVYILDGISTEDYYNSDPYANYVFNDKNIKFISAINEKMLGMIFCYDDEDMKSIASKFRISIKMNYDVPEGIESRGDIFPYLMHPNAYRINTASTANSLRKNKRNIKILFGGNVAEGVYDKESFMLPGGLTRRGIVHALASHYSGTNRVRLVSDSDTFLKIMHGVDGAQLIIFDATTARVGRGEWLPIVSSCEFFLCLPGVLMPMSHNLVEAMSVGTIPILNYPEWLSPKPTHGVNCLTYSTIDELIQVVEYAFHAQPQEVERLRRGALEYHDNYLDPKSFLQSIENSHNNMLTFYCCAEFVTRDVALQRLERNKASRSSESA